MHAMLLDLVLTTGILSPGGNVSGALVAAVGRNLGIPNVTH